MNLRKHAVQVAAVAGIGLLWAAVSASEGLVLKRVEIVSGQDVARLVLDVDGAVTPRAFTLPNPDRIVVDLVGAVNAAPKAPQTFESGPIARVRVSQFQTSPQPVTRVVADLRVKVPYRIETQDEDLVLVVGSGAETENASAATDGSTVAVTTPATATTDVATEAVPVVTAAEEGTTVTPAEAVAFVATVTPVVAVVDDTPVATPSDVAMTEPVPVVGTPAVTESPAAMEPVTVPSAPAQVAAHTETEVEPTDESVDLVSEDTSPGAPRGGVELLPTGSDKRINLDVQEADIHVVLRTLADYAGKNIIASKEVDGTVTVRLFDTPWQEALSSILRAQGYGYVEENGILRVGILQKLRTEELEEAAADRKREDLLPIETQVVRLQFASAEELKPALADMLSGRGKLQVDGRTNALIVSDIPSSVTKVAAMAADLDGRTPQVEIVSKLVDVGMDDSKNLGITWTASVHPPGSSVPISGQVDVPNTQPAGNLRIGTVQAWGQIDATIDALAKNRKANVVSNPTITTVNNREARILVGSKIPLIVSDQAGNAITQLQKIGIQMLVTPHINSDKTITLDLHTEVSELSSQATVQGGVIIQTSEADTRVLVDNSETAVIGGLVRDVQSRTKTGVPVLQDIPLLGWFFRNTNLETAKRDLIIFVTPTLIEPGQKLRTRSPQN
jgi:type IV pilus secretin PilQ/predicted competence protein